jgi:hypothetical protein
MLLCDSCDCGFHWYCVGENHRPPGCRAALALPGLPPGWHTTRPSWREGPWRLRYGWCTMILIN